MSVFSSSSHIDKTTDKIIRLGRHLSDMKYTVMVWRSWVWTLVGSKLGCIVLPSIVPDPKLSTACAIANAITYLRASVFEITSDF